jgi:hypothetical protein
LDFLLQSAKNLSKPRLNEFLIIALLSDKIKA